MKHSTLRSALWGAAVATLFIPTTPYARSDDSSLLGSGRGVDHVMEGVRDLPQARADFAKLGFSVTDGGHFPGGIYNAIIRLNNHSYLELISLMPDPKQDPDILKFISKHDGAMGLGLNVSSASAAATLLRSRDFDVEGPAPGSIMVAGETKPPPPQWYTLGTADKPAPGKLTITLPVFFIEYLDGVNRDKKRDPKLAIHNNTASGIRAVWFAVHDVVAQTKILSQAGFAPAPGAKELLGLKGPAFQASTGTMVLLAGKETDNEAGKFLARYDEGIMALTIDVSDLRQAHQLAEGAANESIPIYHGSFGQSFLLPSRLTHGVRIEMCQE